MAANYGTALTDLGGAVSDLYGSEGAAASAQSYGFAADIARQNEKITEQATNIKEIQESRMIYQSLGTTKAQVGGAGFAESGSALDIMRSSASQGALMKAVTQQQGVITENSYLEQANQFDAMQKAANDSAKGQGIGAYIGAAAAVIAMF